MIRRFPEMLVQPGRQYFELSPLEPWTPRVQDTCPFDEVFEPSVDCLGEVWVRFAPRDETCGTEEGGAVTDLLLGQEEKFIEGLCGGGVP